MKRKQCTACGVKRVLTQFGRRYKDKPQLKPRCKKCDRAYQVAYFADPVKYAEQQKHWLARAKDPAYRRKQRDHQLRNLYGITLDQWNALFKKQGGCCAICDRKKRLVTDHNHTTGKFRGLICYPCNSAIGLIGDTVKAARRMLSYLSVK